MVYSTRRFVLCLALCYCVLVLFSPLSIAITSLGEERASLGVFRTFVRFALIWFCLFPLPLGVWDGLRFVIVALPGLFSYPFLSTQKITMGFGTFADMKLIYKAKCSGSSYSVTQLWIRSASHDSER